MLAVLFTNLRVSAQKKTITVVSANDGKYLQNVLIYYKADIIGETNKLGKVILDLNHVDSVTFVKNEYIDVILSKNQLTEKVTLAKDETIVLNEVVITPLTPEILLKKIVNFYNNKDENGNKKARPSYDLPNKIQIYNIFTANNDTLHYLNNRFSIDKFHFKINNQNKIVKNFNSIKTSKNVYKTYSWRGKESNFPGLTSLTPLGVHYSIDFTDFFDHQDLFDYKIVENEDYYKLEFRQKKKSGLSDIEGFLIVDKFDYGIHEFMSKLLDSKPFFIKETNFSNSKPIVFKILTDTYHFKYAKNEDNYILISSSKYTTFIEEKGDYKDILFTSKIQVEKTVDFDAKNLREFDMLNWNFK